MIDGGPTMRLAARAVRGGRRGVSSDPFPSSENGSGAPRWSPAAQEQRTGAAWSEEAPPAPPGRNAGGLAIHEVRRATIQEAATIYLRPGDEPVEDLAPEEGPHRGPVHQEVLDALRPELVPVTLA